MPKAERDKLVIELYEIISGRVKDFVFKHDSVRVIQCALKYANTVQKKSIAEELRGVYCVLAESRYAKFLIGKLLVQGDTEIRDIIIPEFYGHVRKLINHAEASWIVDDIYRQVASKEQKANMLREWYGPEFAIFKEKSGPPPIAELAVILEQSPEKRKPIMDYLKNLTNQLIQKKMTGFTMLHDAMLQYFLNTKPGSEEASDFLELLKGDEEGDLLKNLAFTSSGSRVVCLALAYGNAKDRRNLLKVYKSHIEMLAFDANGCSILLAACITVDDTREVSRVIFPELLATASSSEVQAEKFIALANSLTGRIPLLYLCNPSSKSLLPEKTKKLIAELIDIRDTHDTSKKQPEVRRTELLTYLAPHVLNVIQTNAGDLAATSYGCQMITEVLLSCPAALTSELQKALEAVAALASGDLTLKEHVVHSAHGCRMLKSLVQGGRFDPHTQRVIKTEPPLNFAAILWPHIQPRVLDWAISEGNFVVLAIVESDTGEKAKAIDALKSHKAALQRVAAKVAERKQDDGVAAEGQNREKAEQASRDREKGMVGAKLLLEKLG